MDKDLGKFKLIIDSFGPDRFKFDEPIKDYTSSGMGGKAKLFFIAFTTAELVKIINMCRQLKLPFFIFGTGSKIMISNADNLGLVIKNRTKNIQTISVKGKVTKFGIGVDEALIEVDSGVSISKFCEYLDSQNLEISEFKSTPGSIGGNLFLNNFLQIKAKSIKVLDLESTIWDIEPKELSLNKHIILSGIFRIKAKIINKI